MVSRRRFPPICPPLRELHAIAGPGDSRITRRVLAQGSDDRSWKLGSVAISRGVQAFRERIANLGCRNRQPRAEVAFFSRAALLQARLRSLQRSYSAQVPGLRSVAKTNLYDTMTMCRKLIASKE